MGMSAAQAGLGASPQVGDGVIRGYLELVNGGSDPIGLIVVGGMKVYGEASHNQLEGRAKATADAIAARLKIRFTNRGWIN
jgi:hypothetical protein